jgi:hypothetical protein
VDIQEFLDRPLLKNLRDLAATVRALSFWVGLLAGAVTYLVLWLKVHSPGMALPIGVATGVWCLTVLGYSYYMKYIYNPPFYEILELEGMLVVKCAGDHHQYIYSRTQRVRATRDDLRLVEFRAHWTGWGSQRPRVESLMSDHAILDGRQAEEDGHVRRWIYPRRPIAKGREVAVGIRQTHEDDINRQLPYFREGGGHYRTGKITVTARFPVAEDPQSIGQVEGRVWNINRPVLQDNVEGAIPCVRKVDRDHKTVDYTVTVLHPKRFHSYGVAWQWPNQENDDD